MSPSICSSSQPYSIAAHPCSYFEAFAFYRCPVWSTQSGDPVRPLLFLSSQWKSECCHLALLLLLTVSQAPVPAPGVGFWLQARGPCQQARNNVAHNLQMLACIRAWQLVMSPPPLPHSSITSHLLPDTSWGRWWGTEAGSLWTEPPFSQEERICHGGFVGMETCLLVLTSVIQQISAAPTRRST